MADLCRLGCPIVIVLRSAHVAVISLERPPALFLRRSRAPKPENVCENWVLGRFLWCADDVPFLCVCSEITFQVKSNLVTKLAKKFSYFFFGQYLFGNIGSCTRIFTRNFEPDRK